MFNIQIIDGLPRETDMRAARATATVSLIVEIVCARRCKLVLKESDLCWCLDFANFQVYE